MIPIAAAFALAGLYLLGRALVRRQADDRRRLASLGRVDAHRQARPDGD